MILADYSRRRREAAAILRMVEDTGGFGCLTHDQGILLIWWRLTQEYSEI